MGSEAAALIGMGLCAAGFFGAALGSLIFSRKPLKRLDANLMPRQELPNIAGLVLLW